MQIKNNKGITLIALALTVVLIIIIAGISVYEGRQTIKDAQLEELRTNMLLIQAKAKEYAEDANFKIGKSTDEATIANVRKEVYEDDAKLKPSSEVEGIPSVPEIPISECYVVTEESLKKWGINTIKPIENEYYLIKFDEKNATAEIYNTEGFQGRYSLTEVDKMEL